MHRGVQGVPWTKSSILILTVQCTLYITAMHGTIEGELWTESLIPIPCRCTCTCKVFQDALPVLAVVDQTFPQRSICISFFIIAFDWNGNLNYDCCIGMILSLDQISCNPKHPSACMFRNSQQHIKSSKMVVKTSDRYQFSYFYV